MNRKRWQDRDGHPYAALLVLHLERELEGQEAESVRLHVDQCAECRSVCEQLQRGFSHFVAFQEQVVVPQGSPHPEALRERMLAAVTGNRKTTLSARLLGLFGAIPNLRLGFALGGAAVALILALVVFLGNPGQSVYASQILDQARVASDSLAGHAKILNQTVRLRRGAFVLERNVLHGQKDAAQTSEPAIGMGLKQALELAHIDLNDPLNANDFAAWRAAQPRHTDSVRETAQELIITTHISGSLIEEGSLTISRSGMRPIARSVEMHGEAPIEISEVSYQITDLPALQPQTTALAPAPTPRGSTEAAASTATAVVSTADLEVSEIDLREALHNIGADTTAAPQIWRSEGTVLFRSTPTDSRQDERIRKTVARIPHVQEMADLSAPPEQPRPAAADSSLAALQLRSAHVLAEAAALDQLGKRYSTERVKGLPPNLRVRVNRLAASLLSSLQHDVTDYFKSLSPRLDAMALDLKSPAASDDGRNLPTCLTWQQNAALASPELRDLDRSISLLFQTQGAQGSAAPVEEKLIGESLRARSFLERHLLSTCQLFGAS